MRQNIKDIWEGLKIDFNNNVIGLLNDLFERSLEQMWYYDCEVSDCPKRNSTPLPSAPIKKADNED